MKKKNLLKKLLALSLIATVSMTGLFACSGPTASAGNTQPSITMPGQTLEVSRYSTTFNEESNTIDIELNATVYPLTLNPVLKWTFESATGGVFDNGTSINDVAEIIPSGSSALVKIKRAFLGGTITVKAETTDLFHNVSGVTEIEYQGVPTSLSVSCNGEKGSEDNPIGIYANQTYTIDVDLDNYFDVIGNGETLTNFMYENIYVVLNGTAKAKVTSVIDDKTVENNLSVDLKNNFSGCNFDFYDQPDEYALHNLDVNADLEIDDIYTYEVVRRENENGQLSYSISVSSATELSFTKTWAELYPNRTDLPSGYVTVEYDFSDVILNCGYNFSFSNSEYLREVCYFKIIPTATGLEIAGGNVVI